MLATKSPEMRETVMVLKELSTDERARLIFEAREKARRDEAARIYGATKKGMAEGMEKGIEKGMEKGMKKGMDKGMEKGMEKGMKKGMEKGRTEGKAEVAKNLLALGVNVEVISKSSGLSVEEIKSFSGA
jgi:flagellar biosynthesis/type III secretory pathway protein FliH